MSDLLSGSVVVRLQSGACHIAAAVDIKRECDFALFISKHLYLFSGSWASRITAQKGSWVSPFRLIHSSWVIRITGELCISPCLNCTDIFEQNTQALS